jgi:hypothetical protein
MPTRTRTVARPVAAVKLDRYSFSTEVYIYRQDGPDFPARRYAPRRQSLRRLMHALRRRPGSYICVEAGLYSLTVEYRF